RHGILVEQSAAPKSELYLAFLPLVTARRVELPEDRRLLTQLAQLERRSRSGGEAAQPGPSLGIMARGLAPKPVRVGLSLLDGPVVAEDDFVPAELEDVLWRVKGERPPCPTDSEC
ncbi:MAG: hypothetical protein ACREKH_15820, partial [Candidatus Rokuibacteriota bacterium]